MIKGLGVTEISIHAPARGATAGSWNGKWSGEDFNPRSREGSDRYFVTFSSKSHEFQSTLPRGERRMTKCVFASQINFNPRSREGSDDVG